MIAGGPPAASGLGWLWSGNATIKGSSESMRMALLTASLIGIQFTWCIEMTYCTPYLLKLGLTKSQVSLVWIAGPLSGLIIQPVVGIIADRSKSPYGRRRPYMLVGSTLACFGLLLLGWTSEIVSMFILDRKNAELWTVILAVFSIYSIDFAINAAQASARGLIVDTLPSSKQQHGAAWSSRMVAIGHLFGYAAGAIDLTCIFGSVIGDSQFKQLIIVSTASMLGTVGVTCWAVKERVLVSLGEDESQDEFNIATMVSSVVRAGSSLPRRVSTVCWIQFWSWIGWFPFHFYLTTWIGEVYMRFNASDEVRDHPDSLAQIGRLGSRTLVVFSLITLITSVVVPLLVQAPDDGDGEYTPRPPAAMANMLLELYKNKPSLLTVWTYSHIIFAGSMVCTPFVTSIHPATILIALCGIPWAMQCWAPFTVLGIEINRLNSVPKGNDSGPTKSRISWELTISEKPIMDVESLSNRAADSGLYLGILNLYTTLPQFIGTFISWAVFSVLEPGKSPELARYAHPDEHHATDGLNAISVCLFIGAIAAILAARETRKLKAG